MRCWKCRFEAEHLKDGKMSDIWSKLTSMVVKGLEEQTEHVKNLQNKIDALEDVICKSTPTGWVASGDLGAASKWEKEALGIVNISIAQEKSNEEVF